MAWGVIRERGWNEVLLGHEGSGKEEFGPGAGHKYCLIVMTWWGWVCVIVFCLYVCFKMTSVRNRPDKKLNWSSGEMLVSWVGGAVGNGQGTKEDLESQHVAGRAVP